MSENIIKIEIQLDQELKAGIDIISKMFKWTTEELIKAMIKKELFWIKEQIQHEQENFLLEYFYRSELKNEILNFLEGL